MSHLISRMPILFCVAAALTQSCMSATRTKASAAGEGLAADAPGGDATHAVSSAGTTPPPELALSPSKTEPAPSTLSTLSTPSTPSTLSTAQATPTGMVDGMAVHGVTKRVGAALYLFIYASKDLSSLTFKDGNGQDFNCSMRAQPQTGWPFVCYVQASMRYRSVAAISGTMTVDQKVSKTEIPIEHR